MLEIINQALVKNKDFKWLSQAVGAFVLKKEATATKRLPLPPLLDHFLRDYHRAGGRRDSFILKWTLKGLDNLTLSCVSPQLRDSLLTTKLLIILEDFCLDDIADKFQDRALLNLVIDSLRRDNLPNTRPQINNEYGQFCLRLWRQIKSDVRNYPRFREFKDLFRRYNDLFWETLIYSLEINENPEIIENLILDAHQRKSAHNMNGLIVFAVDLMGSPSFDREEFELMQKAVENAQIMGRIGNSITTWERELPDRDFTSDVFVWAVANKVLTVAELQSGDRESVVNKIQKSDVYEAMFARWKAHRQKIAELVPQVKSVDLKAYLTSLDKLFFMHLASRGLK